MGLGGEGMERKVIFLLHYGWGFVFICGGEGLQLMCLVLIIFLNEHHNHC